jgi:ABC-type nitrate/sulfonate/bicarbonate transport system permease component
VSGATKTGLAARIAYVLSIPLLFATWQLLCSLEFVNPLLFPSPLAVLGSLGQYLKDGDGFADLGASLGRVCVGYFAGAVTGVAVGLLTGARPLIRNLLAPALQLLRPVPPIAFVPLVVVWFGLSEWGKWFLVFWGVFFAVWLATHSGVERVNPYFLRAAQSLGESQARALLTVQLPAAAPVIVVGLRTAVSIAFYTLVAAELAGASLGVAYRMEITQQNLQVAHTIAGMVLIGLSAAVADRAFEWCAARVVHWSA